MANPYDDLIENPYESLVSGEIQKPENFLQKIINAGNAVGDFSEGFADTQTLGLNRLASYGGKKLASMVVPGEDPPGYWDQPEQTTARSIGQAVPVARGVQQLFAGGAKMAFPKHFAKKELPEASGRLTKSLQNVIGKSKSNPKTLGVDKNELLGFIKEQYGKSVNPTGREASVFRSWIKTLEGTKKTQSKVGSRVTADILDEMESQFGKASGFSSKPSNPKLAHGAKEVRRFVSNKLDEIAHNAGVKDFSRSSLEKSKLLSTISKKPSGLSKAIKRVSTGALTGGGAALAGKTIWDLFS